MENKAPYLEKMYLGDGARLEWEVFLKKMWCFGLGEALLFGSEFVISQSKSFSWHHFQEKASDLSSAVEACMLALHSTQWLRSGRLAQNFGMSTFSLCWCPFVMVICILIPLPGTVSFHEDI